MSESKGRIRQMTDTNDAKKTELVAAIREKYPEVAEALDDFASEIRALKARVLQLEIDMRSTSRQPSD
jgi:hypothetical protein